MARKNDDNRNRWTEDKVKTVIFMRKGGATVSEIVRSTGFGKSTVQCILRCAKHLMKADYISLLREFSIAKTKKLTPYSIKKVDMLHKATFYKKPSKEELEEALKELIGEEPAEEADEGIRWKPEVPKGRRLVQETKSCRVQLTVGPTLLENLKAKAAEKETSVNNLVNTVLSRYLGMVELDEQGYFFKPNSAELTKETLREAHRLLRDGTIFELMNYIDDQLENYE